jgi:hypothetical protein
MASIGFDRLRSAWQKFVILALKPCLLRKAALKNSDLSENPEPSENALMATAAVRTRWKKGPGTVDKYLTELPGK